MARISLSEHAVLRFRERVKPALTIGQAKAELLKLSSDVEPVTAMQIPDWARRDLGGSQTVVELADGIVLVLEPDAGRKGRWVAVTCKTRGGMSPARREFKNARKAHVRKARALRRRKREARAVAKQARAADGLR